MEKIMKDEKNHILRVDCPDRKGLVHNITGVLFNNGLNITSNGEFVDKATSHFFMRTGFTGRLDRSRVEKELSDILDKDALVQLSENSRKKTVVLASKEPHCLGDLLVRNEYKQMNAEIKTVISNHDVLRKMVEAFGLPYEFLSAESYSREKHEEMISAEIDKYNPDFIVLAKYMRVLTPALVAKYKNRIINIHHSFLPAFIGASPYQQAFDRGVKIIGATAHFVTDLLDDGQIITQDVIHIDHTYGPEEMRQAGRDVEKAVLARALKLVFEDRVFISGNKTVIFD